MMMGTVFKITCAFVAYLASACGLALTAVYGYDVFYLLWDKVHLRLEYTIPIAAVPALIFLLCIFAVKQFLDKNYIKAENVSFPAILIVIGACSFLYFKNNAQSDPVFLKYAHCEKYLRLIFPARTINDFETVIFSRLDTVTVRDFQLAESQCRYEWVRDTFAVEQPKVCKKQTTNPLDRLYCYRDLRDAINQQTPFDAFEISHYMGLEFNLIKQAKNSLNGSPKAALLADMEALEQIIHTLEMLNDTTQAPFIKSKSKFVESDFTPDIANKVLGIFGKQNQDQKSLSAKGVDLALILIEWKTRFKIEEMAFKEGPSLAFKVIDSLKDPDIVTPAEVSYFRDRTNALITRLNKVNQSIAANPLRHLLMTALNTNFQMPSALPAATTPNRMPSSVLIDISR